MLAALLLNLDGGLPPALEERLRYYGHKHDEDFAERVREKWDAIERARQAPPLVVPQPVAMKPAARAMPKMAPAAPRDPHAMSEADVTALVIAIFHLDD